MFFKIVYWTYYQGTFNLHCNLATTATDTSILGQHQVYATYYYFLLKILDLFDTVNIISFSPLLLGLLSVNAFMFVEQFGSGNQSFE